MTRFFGSLIVAALILENAMGQPLPERKFWLSSGISDTQKPGEKRVVSDEVTFGVFAGEIGTIKIDVHAGTFEGAANLKLYRVTVQGQGADRVITVGDEIKFKKATVTDTTLIIEGIDGLTVPKNDFVRVRIVVDLKHPVLAGAPKAYDKSPVPPKK